jgi:hypothetical protein
MATVCEDYTTNQQRSVVRFLWAKGLPGAEVADATVEKHYYAAGFDELLKRRDKCISVGGGYMKK